MARTTLNVYEIQYLIAHKPLVIVKLQHSKENKALVIKALTNLSKTRKGEAIFETLKAFLTDVAPKYQLDANQDGARRFLLREIERISTKPNRRSRWQNLLAAAFFGSANS